MCFLDNIKQKLFLRLCPPKYFVNEIKYFIIRTFKQQKRLFLYYFSYSHCKFFPDLFFILKSELLAFKKLLFVQLDQVIYIFHLYFCHFCKYL